MRKRYSASFNLGSQDVGVPTSEDVAARCLRWVAEGGRGLLPAEVEAEPGSTFDSVDIGEGATVSALRVVSGDQDLWGLRLDHVDHELDDLLWRTEICLAHDLESDEVAFSCDNMAGSVSQSVTPITRTPSRPRIVPQVLREWKGYKGGYSLKADVHVLKSDEVDGFLDTLLSPSRRRPVVFISAKNDDDRPLIDAGKVADWLAGVAHVVVAESRFPVRRMEDRLPDRFRCFNGAIRIYWPGLSFNDPYRHKLWLPDRILDKERWHDHGFREFLLGYVSEFATAVFDPEAPSWALLESIRRQNQIEEAIKKGDQADLIELYEEDNKELNIENADLKMRTSDLYEQVRKERAKAKAWFDAYVEARKSANPELPEHEVRPLPESVSEAIDYAAEDYADELVFALNNKSDGHNSIFEQPDEVHAAFKFLATTYFKAKTGEVACADLDQAVRTEVGWRFEANQSQTAIGKYPEWYQCCYEDRTYTLEEHVKTGSSKDPRHTMRIAFAWDGDLSKVIIGFVGQHQKTDAT